MAITHDGSDLHVIIGHARLRALDTLPHEEMRVRYRQTDKLNNDEVFSNESI